MTKIRDLSAATAVTATTIFEVTTDPSGTPASEKATALQVADYILNGAVSGATEATSMDEATDWLPAVVSSNRRKVSTKTVFQSAAGLSLKPTSLLADILILLNSAAANAAVKTTVDGILVAAAEGETATYPTDPLVSMIDDGAGDAISMTPENLAKGIIVNASAFSGTIAVSTDLLFFYDASAGQLMSITPAGLLNVIGVLSQFSGAIDGAADRLFYFEDGVGMQWISPDHLVAGKHTIFIPAGAMVSTTTNGAADGSTELATNDVMLKTKDFDTGTAEKAQFMCPLPKGYNGSTVTVRGYWTAASGSGGVAIEVAARAFSDDDALDQAFGTAVVLTDTLITANDLHVTAESSAMTIAGTPADHDMIAFQVSRAVANGSDTLGVDMKLLGIAVYFTTDARDDT